MREVMQQEASRPEERCHEERQGDGDGEHRGDEDQVHVAGGFAIGFAEGGLGRGPEFRGERAQADARRFAGLPRGQKRDPVRLGERGRQLGGQKRLAAGLRGVGVDQGPGLDEERGRKREEVVDVEFIAQGGDLSLDLVDAVHVAVGHGVPPVFEERLQAIEATRGGQLDGGRVHLSIDGHRRLGLPQVVAAQRGFFLVRRVRGGRRDRRARLNGRRRQPRQTKEKRGGRTEDGASGFETIANFRRERCARETGHGGREGRIRVVA